MQKSFFLLVAKAWSESCFKLEDPAISFGLMKGTKVSNLDQLKRDFEGRVGYDYAVNGVRACRDKNGYLTALQV